jgi:hypothetical protein
MGMSGQRLSRGPGNPDVQQCPVRPHEFTYKNEAYSSLTTCIKDFWQSLDAACRI